MVFADMLSRGTEIITAICLKEYIISERVVLLPVQLEMSPRTLSGGMNLYPRIVQEVIEPRGVHPQWPPSLFVIRRIHIHIQTPAHVIDNTHK